MAVGWRVAMAAALYGSEGFFIREPGGPAEHFRTSVHASPLFAGAVLALIKGLDEALGHPGTFDVVDVGAGRGELLTALHALIAGDGGLARRVRFTGVEMRARPNGLDRSIRWRRHMPDQITGMLVATEWLDNVPIDVAEVDDDGNVRRVLVDRASGEERLGAVVDAADRFWLARWWPTLTEPGLTPPGRMSSPALTDGRPGERAEIGWPRDVAWADAVSRVKRGCALAVDYGHLRSTRPGLGTLTGFRAGRQVAPVPDGSCDVTAHVAIDAVAGSAGTPFTLVTQREALRALGINGGRPPIDLAHTDPADYLRALSAAGAAAELIDPAGLGGHWWLLHSIGVEPLLP
jgi:SAM-dependent MidA family methyltransferase